MYVHVFFYTIHTVEGNSGAASQSTDPAYTSPHHPHKHPHTIAMSHNPNLQPPERMTLAPWRPRVT